jgi:dinuclear metal center YbgI/SA1388 family protein
MKIETIITALDECLHPALQEGYDNSGAQIILRGTDITSILLALDIDALVLEEAIKKNCGLIITHHPLFFNELKKIDTKNPESALIVKIIESRINVYSAHTNLDKLFFDKMAKTIGFNTIDPLFPHQPVPDGILTGFGALVNLEKPTVLKQILADVKKALKLEFIVYTGDMDQKVKKIALLNGAGGRSIEKIIQDTAADCIITGDVGYHHAKYAADHKVAVLDAGHFGTEILMLGFLRDHIRDCLTNKSGAVDIPIYLSESEKDPFRLYGTANE